MYQSPVAAIAELVSNAWDADAERVRIILPGDIGPSSEIVVADNGSGMSLKECQDRFLEVGADRRQGRGVEYSKKDRKILGRKGIGKFAGFGIARIMRVETTNELGEFTSFELDIDRLRTGEYVSNTSLPIEVLEHQPPFPGREGDHGTTIRLRSLLNDEAPSPLVFGRSMARRFLLHQRIDDFEVLVNESPLPGDDSVEKAQFVFPRDYALLAPDMRPAGVVEGSDGWATEEVANHGAVRWRFVFYPDPINDTELRGIAIFANRKLAQTPFDFNIVGGVGGQHGLEYLSGAVEADYIDQLTTDLIAPERQRVDWNRAETRPLLEWGRRRIRELLPRWQELRNKEKLDQLTDKLSPFNARLNDLPSHERRIIKGTLQKLAGLSRLSGSSFRDLANAILTAWEGGRLRDLIHSMSDTQNMTAEDFLALLLEAEVMTALNTAEAVKTKILTIDGLRTRIEKRELENLLRDYIAEHPWLISPKWETFRKEQGLGKLIRLAAQEAELHKNSDWDGRIDLALSSGDTLLILEFMRPGLTIDLEHVLRFRSYMASIETHVGIQTGGQISRVAGGYLVADKLAKKPALMREVTRAAHEGYLYLDWDGLLRGAEAQWRDFIDIVRRRSPDDVRIRELVSTHVGNSETDIAESDLTADA